MSGPERSHSWSAPWEASTGSWDTGARRLGTRPEREYVALNAEGHTRPHRIDPLVFLKRHAVFRDAVHAQIFKCLKTSKGDLYRDRESLKYNSITYSVYRPGVYYYYTR